MDPVAEALLRANAAAGGQPVDQDPVAAALLQADQAADPSTQFVDQVSGGAMASGFPDRPGQDVNVPEVLEQQAIRGGAFALGQDPALTPIPAEEVDTLGDYAANAARGAVNLPVALSRMAARPVIAAEQGMEAQQLPAIAQVLRRLGLEDAAQAVEQRAATAAVTSIEQGKMSAEELSGEAIEEVTIPLQFLDALLTNLVPRPDPDSIPEHLRRGVLVQHHDPEAIKESGEQFIRMFKEDPTGATLGALGPLAGGLIKGPTPKVSALKTADQLAAEGAAAERPGPIVEQPVTPSQLEAAPETITASQLREIPQPEPEAVQAPEQAPEPSQPSRYVESRREKAAQERREADRKLGLRPVEQRVGEPRPDRVPFESLLDRVEAEGDETAQRAALKDISREFYDEVDRLSRPDATNADKIARIQASERLSAVQEKIASHEERLAGKPEGAEPSRIPKRVSRVEDAGVETQGPGDKPQGLYTSDAATKPFQQEGLEGTRTEYEVNPGARVLEVDTTDLVKTERGRGMSVGQSAGVAAARKLLGEELTQSWLMMTKRELLPVVEGRYPDIEWGRYYDSTEMVEAVAGIEARKAGYDAIWDPDPGGVEYVALTDKAFRKDQPAPPSKPVQSPPQVEAAAPVETKSVYAIGETVYSKGDPIRITTEPYEKHGGVWQDGVDPKGKTRTVPTPEWKRGDQAKRAADRAEQQAGFRRLKNAEPPIVEKKLRKKPRSANAPESPRADPKGFARWVRSTGGMWDEALAGELRQASQNYPGLIGLRSKKGRSFDQMAEGMVELWPEEFKTRAEAFEWLRDEWAGGAKETVTRAEAPPPGPVYEQSQVDAYSQGSRDGDAGKPKSEVPEWQQAAYDAGYAETYRPTMEEAAKAGDEARETAAAEKKTEAVIGRKRQAEAKAGQGSLIDEDVNALIDQASTEAEAAGEFEGAQATLGEDFGKYGASNAVITKARYQEALKRLDQKRIKKLLDDDPSFFSGPVTDLTAIKEVVEIGAYHAEALARSAAGGIADFAEWAKRVTKDLKDLLGEKYTATYEDLRRLWEQKEIRQAKRQRSKPTDTLTRSYGKAKAFETALGKQRGTEAFDTLREAHGRANLAERMIQEGDRERFGRGFVNWWLDKGERLIGREGRRVSRKDLEAAGNAARGIPELKPDGSPVFGALARSGTFKLPKLATLEYTPGHMLLDGRVMGHKIADREWQTYRPVMPDEAKATYDALSPKAKRVLDDYLTTKEDPVYTPAGDRMPSFARAALKDQYGVEGLTAEEASAASEYVRMAYQGTGETTPNQFSYVPESGVMSQRGPVQRFRQSLRSVRAGARKRKGGATAEAVREGLYYDFGKASRKARVELMREAISEEVAGKLLSLVAEPIKKGETPGSLAADNFVPFSKTGLWAESSKVRRFFERNSEYFTEQGIDVPDTTAAIFKAGGKGFKVPKRVAQELGVMFQERAAIPKKLQGIDRALGNVIAGINTLRLTRISTANRNLLANTIMHSTKVLRDFYAGVLDTPGAVVDVMRGEPWAYPFQDMISDVRALPVTLARDFAATPVRKVGKAFGKDVAGGQKARQIPPEMVGSTMLMEMEGAGAGAKVSGKMLRWTGFNYWDIYTKRAIYEAVVDAHAREAWRATKRSGQGRKGRSKKQFINDFKASIPREVESVAYREADVFGGFDYWNVPEPLAKLKQLKTGRGTIPYPTYFYKLTNHYRELWGLHNFQDLASGNWRQKKRAAANLLTASTMAALMWELVGDNGDLPEGVHETDLSYDVQKFGRLKVPRGLTSRKGMTPSEDMWARLYDMPHLGEVMFAKALFGGKYSVTDWLNDRISTGPLFAGVALSTDLTTRFNKEIPQASRAGRELSSWLPPAVGDARKLVDIFKRVPGRETDPWWQNFYGGLAENIPWLSATLDERIYSEREFKTYKRPAVLMSHGLLNIHVIDEEQREQAIWLTRVGYLDKLKGEKRKDTMRVLIREQMDREGKTTGGQIKRIGRRQEAERREALALMQIDIYEAWGREKDGGPKAALQAARAAIKAETDPERRKAMKASARRLLKQLDAKTTDMGMAEVMAAPKRLRRPLRRELERLKSEAR